MTTPPGVRHVATRRRSAPARPWRSSEQHPALGRRCAETAEPRDRRRGHEGGADGPLRPGEAERILVFPCQGRERERLGLAILIDPVSALESGEPAEPLFGSARRPGLPPRPCGFAARVPHPVRRVRQDVEQLAGSELSSTTADLDMQGAGKDLEVLGLRGGCRANGFRPGGPVGFRSCPRTSSIVIVSRRS